MLKILLIEPNTVLATTYRQALQYAGYVVDHVTGAQGALFAADTSPPSIVVMELQLPHHSGLEFLHEFRSYAEWRQVPIIVNTLLHPSRLAFATEALTRDFGVQTVLYKPQASLKDLLSAIRTYAVAVAE